jgi:3-hexulose-6-phosphate synthase
MALASDATIEGALASARSLGKRIMIDMMQVADPLARAGQLLALGCDLLCLHTAHDLQSSQASPYAQLAQLRAALPAAQLAIAGGVKLDTLEQILPLGPQVIIVGSGITAAPDPGATARQFHERIRHDKA